MVKRTARKYGLEAEEVVLISAHKGWGIDALLESINRFRNHQDVYIVGTTNVGKSTLINKLIEQSVKRCRYNIKISRYNIRYDRYSFR